MPQPVVAAVLEQYHTPLEVKELEVDEPRPGEVLVKAVATGVCHTDAITRDADLPFPAPGVLGHEGAGIVEAVGGDVTMVAPGDRVVVGWPWCGVCRNCQAGRHRYCELMPPMVTMGSRFDHSCALHRPGGGDAVHSHYFGQSSFSTRYVTWERSCVKVADDAPLELLGPLACGLSTGAGTVLNTLDPEPGSSIAIFGTGAVGLSALAMASEKACTTIIGVDLVDSRLKLATEFGATHTVNAKEANAVDAIREITGGRGVDYAVETTGNVAVLRNCTEALAMPGVCAVVGGAPAGAEFTLDHLTILWGRSVRGTLGGEGQSASLIPTLIDLHRLGRFPFDRMVEYFDLEQVNEAMEASHHGEVIKPVLRMPA
ncbi:MAG TPA: NAD(P)-dependent alcohol dehydrogenase [Solirubrobacteraceae bacterium]|nr:NAD(P)-dependent alcohol dehydrogenase [Solirubrobacteraceae bacterium]